MCESQLHGRGIRYYVKNQLLQDLVIGAMGVTGPMEIQVSTEDADKGASNSGTPWITNLPNDARQWSGGPTGDSDS